MKTSNCPQCQVEVKFGLQRCTTCGTLIFWKNHGQIKVPVVRRDPLNFPQKAEVHLNAYGREKKDDSSPVVREYFPRERVVAIGMEGDYVALETGGWVHFSEIGLFGKLYRLTVICPTGENTFANVLDRPAWGTTPEERGNLMYPIAIGVTVEIWETVPYWVRISAGNGHWLSTYWLKPEDVAKL